jgi:hypothetical protein
MQCKGRPLSPKLEEVQRLIFATEPSWMVQASISSFFAKAVCMPAHIGTGTYRFERQAGWEKFKQFLAVWFLPNEVRWPGQN